MRFAKKTGIGDTALCEAIRDAERGLIAADLGGGVVKQRITHKGQGKSGGFGTAHCIPGRGVRFLRSWLRGEQERQHRTGRTGRPQEARIRVAGL